jgi:hypothetical protein
MSEYSEIRYEVADSVATITLHRPDRLNAFSATMARELVAAFDAADTDDDVRAVLMTGSGRGFCAGADLGRGTGTFDATDETRAAERADFETIGGVPRDGGGVVSLRIAASRKPVIVAINGPAVGVGARRPTRLPGPARRRAAAGRARARCGDRREHLGGLGRAFPADAVVDARRRYPVGGAPARLARDLPARPGP